MDTQRNLARLPAATVACIGTFDGMHRGHQMLLRRASELGDRLAVVTFDPRPADVLAPEHAPARLQSDPQRARICAALGVDHLVLIGFDRRVAALSPTEFVTEFLIDGLRPTAVVVGEDFRFGHKRAGDVAALASALSDTLIPCESIPLLTTESGKKLGSTSVRALLRAGDVETAADRLGYLHAVDGIVATGQRRGRTLGFPTANVAANGLRPGPGVYAGWARVHALDPRKGRVPPVLAGPVPAAINIGTNPTFERANTTGVEAHLIDTPLPEDILYGATVEISFSHRLRDEKRFDGPELLRTAIAGDVAQAKVLLNRDGPGARRPGSTRQGARGTGT